jgi:hypothetical protein
MAYLHIPGVKVAAKFSADRQFRYRLEMVLENPAGRTLTACVVMQNPSYAGEAIADKSVQFMEKNVFLRNLPMFAQVRRLIVVNQFARIQTNQFQGLPHEVGPRNDAAIQAALAESAVIIIGWGSSNRFEARKMFVIEELRKLKGKQIFQTRMHPSRGRYDGFIQPFQFPEAAAGA